MKKSVIIDIYIYTYVVTYIRIHISTHTHNIYKVARRNIYKVSLGPVGILWGSFGGPRGSQGVQRSTTLAGVQRSRGPEKDLGRLELDLPGVPLRCGSEAFGCDHLDLQVSNDTGPLWRGVENR